MATYGRSYTISEFAELVGVDPDTLRNWEENGLLKPLRIGMRQDRRYTIEHANLAKEKGLISELVKKAPQRDYLKMDKEDLIKEIQTLKSQKKFGLVWETENVETIEKDIKKNINKAPILKNILKRKIDTTGKDKNKLNKKDKIKNSKDIEMGDVEKFSPTNILIEGDNYDTLKILNYTHQEKIDVIYIDPPYNTGNKDFKYNDSFVDKENAYRHSKWLSFMEKRLRLAYDLLSKNGVIFISIDDNEQARLKLLCDEIFGEENFVTQIVWQKKSSPKGVPPVNMIVETHEYVLIYQKSDKFSFNGRERNIESFKNPDNDPRGLWVNNNIKSTIKAKDTAFTIIDPKTGNEYTDTWAFSKNELDRMILEERIIFPKNKNGQVRAKAFLNEFKNESIPLISNWGLYDGQGSTEFLENILGSKNFQNPKHFNLIYELLKYSSQKNSTILDFFAGSGTTGHAVLELNKEDGGNRQFILATNNENNICEEVTFERIKRVMTGYKNLKGENIEGIGGRLEYLKTDFVDMEKMEMISDDKRLAFTLEAGWTIALKENVFTEIESNEYYQIFEGEVMDDTKITKNKNKKIENKNNEKNYDSNKKNNEENNEDSLNVENKIIKKTVAIYFKENLDRLEELEEKILDKENVRLYIYSNDIGEFEDDYKEYKNITVCDIPEPILRVYRGN